MKITAWSLWHITKDCKKFILAYQTKEQVGLAMKKSIELGQIKEEQIEEFFAIKVEIKTLDS